MNEHQHGEDNEMQTGQSFRELFIVARVVEPVRPAEAAFNHRSSRKKNELLSGLRQLDDRDCSVRLSKITALGGLALTPSRHAQYRAESAASEVAIPE
jgi:hypothetical protein